jgi:HK97 gp10 family phage protein
MIEVKVEGMEALKREFAKLPQELHAKALRLAVNAAAGVVRKQAMTTAPVDTRVLRKAIYQTRSRSESSASQETAIVGIRFGKKYRRRGMDAWYWKFIEFGTSKLSARPFLRPAFESTKSKQVDAIVARLRKFFLRYRG